MIFGEDSYGLIASKTDVKVVERGIEADNSVRTAV
jgi:hypothetical protein